MTMRMVMMTRRMVTVIRTLVELRMQMNMRPIVAVMAMENDAMVFAGRRTGIQQDAFAIARPVEDGEPAPGAHGQLHSASSLAAA